MSLSDEYGQAPSRVIRAQQVADRSIDELIGLCKGISADNKICIEEVEYMKNWLIANEHIRDKWPANIIAARVVSCLEDGYLSKEELDDLFELMKTIVGNCDGSIPYNFSTLLPFDNPLPNLYEKIYQHLPFCLTGKFIFGSRYDCTFELECRGKSWIDSPRKSGCILVIGFLGSRDWVHSTHGRKIEQAVYFREENEKKCECNEWSKTVIISEDHWVDWLMNVPIKYPHMKKR